jgi:hypothetical protein
VKIIESIHRNLIEADSSYISELRSILNVTPPSYTALIDVLTQASKDDHHYFIDAVLPYAASILNRLPGVEVRAVGVKSRPIIMNIDNKGALRGSVYVASLAGGTKSYHSSSLSGLIASMRKHYELGVGITVKSDKVTIFAARNKQGSQGPYPVVDRFNLIRGGIRLGAGNKMLPEEIEWLRANTDE